MYLKIINCDVLSAEQINLNELNGHMVAYNNSYLSLVAQLK